MSLHPFTRRSFLQCLGLGAASAAASQLFPAFSMAQSVDPDTAPLLVFCTFQGGWDQLLALDPRDNTVFTDQSTIHAGYDLLAESDAELDAILSQTGGTGLVKPQGSNITFGPAVGRLSDLFADLAVIRGVDMGTVTHEVGRRYFLTGKFPRGLAANGSALSTAFSVPFPCQRSFPADDPSLMSSRRRSDASSKRFRSRRSCF